MAQQRVVVLTGAGISAESGIRTYRDGDGLWDGIELELGTNPLLSDTDGDGYTDGEESDEGTSPTDADDLPLQGLNMAIIKAAIEAARDR